MVATAFGGWVMLAQRPQFSFTGPRGGEVFLATAEVAQAMHYLLHQLDRRVEHLVPTSSWRAPGFDPGGVGRSNHHAGTAVDQNGDRHPYEAHVPAGQWRCRYTTPQVRTIREVLAELANDDGRPVVRWGLDFRVGKRDPMHFEIARTNGTDSLFVGNAEVAQANARVLRIVGSTQRAVRAKVDHMWGPKTHQRVRAVRARARGLALDKDVTTGFVQNVVGAPATGTWDGPSREALVDTVKKLQRAWRVHDDGSWGEVTEAAFTLQSRKFLHYKPIVVP